MSLAAPLVPNLYEYYSAKGVIAGLSARRPYFTLNNKNITIYSGAFHYFRVPRDYWRDRLRKMRAAGLNTVETLIPWSLHEPYSGVYDFGDGGSEMEDFLHLEEFLKTAKEEDLFVFARPGPYINSDLDYGGLPSWLSRDTKTVRNSKDAHFLTYVNRWFNVLLPLLVSLQFQRGGSIIGFQLEHEYGSSGRDDLPYLRNLQALYRDNRIRELLYTCDRSTTTNLMAGRIPGILMTTSFITKAKENLDVLKAAQPSSPPLVMEFRTGASDHWMDPHHNTIRPAMFNEVLQDVINYPASFNMYMFVGGTNYHFTGGATMSAKNFSDYRPITTSYDFDAPISETGNYTEKYTFLRDSILRRSPIHRLPLPPDISPVVSYQSLQPVGYIPLQHIISDFKEKISSETPVAMEMLPINHNSGQSFGYIAYRKTNLNIPAGATLKISGFIRDTILVLLNGKLISPVPKSAEDLDGFGFWRKENSSLLLTDKILENAVLDLIVENFGRNTIAAKVPKGITGDVCIDSENLTQWDITPLEFRKSWNNELSGWRTIHDRNNTAALYMFSLNIRGKPADTYLDMSRWTKGIAIVNGFVIGRYFFLGPQQTHYLPAPFLKTGTNHIIIFEHYSAAEELSFTSEPIYNVSQM